MTYKGSQQNMEEKKLNEIFSQKARRDAWVAQSVK